MTQQTPSHRDVEKSLPRSAGRDITPVPSDSVSRQKYPSVIAESPFSLLMRILFGALCLFLIAGFLLAAKLEPSPRGYGTHQQLGLAPCSIQILFGIPCPSCGMTTSFSWFVRGHFLNAASANPAGLYLAIICAVLIPWTAAVSLWNRCLLIHNPHRWAILLGCVYFLVAIVQWGVRYTLEIY